MYRIEHSGNVINRTYAQTCPNCLCEFIFTINQVRMKKHLFGIRSFVIECPECCEPIECNVPSNAARYLEHTGRVR